MSNDVLRSRPHVHVFFSASCSLHDDPESRFITEYSGQIFVRDKSDEERLAGAIKAFVVDLPMAEAAQIDLFELFDMREELDGFAEVLLDPGSGKVREDLEERAAITAWDPLLILDRMEIEPSCRGNNVGLKALEIAFQYLGAGCSGAVLKAHPLQFESNRGGDPRPHLDGFTKDEALAKKNLIDHYARIGFTLWDPEEGVMVRTR